MASKCRHCGAPVRLSRDGYPTYNMPQAAMSGVLKFTIHKREAGTMDEFYIAYLLDADGKPLRSISNSESETVVTYTCTEFAQALEMDAEFVGKRGATT